MFTFKGNKTFIPTITHSV